jgi:flagellar hook-associated protein 3 FlgL
VNEVDAGGSPLPAILEITRRNGTTTNVDLQGASTVQDVLNAINAADPGVLTAALNAVGNGISITDTSGTGPLSIAPGNVAVALGVDGTEPGPANTTPLAGRDVNPRQATGVLSLLVQLQSALQSGDNRELERLDPLFSSEIERFNQMRGELGNNIKTLEQIESRLADRQVSLEESLSKEFDSDLAETITQLAKVSATFQAILQMTAQSYQLSLMNYL